MEKIKALLEQLGGKEVADKVLEALNKYETDLRATNESEFKARLDKARQVCLEETTLYKAELARKVQLYFEARAERIEQMMAKRTATRESVAEGKLKKVAALLDGVSVDAASDADLKTAKEEVANLQKNLKALKEERDEAVRKANHAYVVAERALKRTNLTEGTANLTPTKIVKAASKPLTTRKVMAEQIQKPAPRVETPANVFTGQNASPEAIAAGMVD